MIAWEGRIYQQKRQRTEERSSLSGSRDVRGCVWIVQSCYSLQAANQAASRVI